MSALPSGNACLVEAAGCWRQWVRLTACNLLVLSQAFGAPGDLDPTFGNGGKVITAIGSDSAANSVAVQSDGKIVVAGYSRNGSNDDFALVRYTPAGVLDASFGSGGKVTTDFGGRSEQGSSVAVLSDGKIVVAGQTYNGSDGDFALVRYTAAGALDTSFGNSGKVTTAIGNYDDYGSSLAVQSDGKIVVAGTATFLYEIPSYAFYSYFAVVRYTSAGALDTSFGTGGNVTAAIVGSDEGHSVAVQSDGRIVVAGRTYNGSNWDFGLVRYTTAGALDVSFGSGGKVTTAFASSHDFGQSVGVQSDGKIVVSGTTYNASNYDIALARYTATGVLDTSFGSGGKVTTPNGSGQSVVVQSDGKIIVAGTSSNGSNNDFALVRYTATGTLDASFGNGGKVTTDFGSNSDGGSSAALQSDGKIVVAGSSVVGGHYDFALARYEVNGLPALANWRLTYFGTTDNSGNAADGAAPDGDGIVNLLKYGLVIAPGISGASSLPQGQRKVYAEGARLAVVFLHNQARNDIGIEVQAADQPEGPWTTVASSVGGAVFSGAGFVSETGPVGGLNTVEVRDIVNIDVAPHRYMHIKVTH